MNREEEYTFEEIDRSLTQFKLYQFAKSLLKNIIGKFSWFLASFIVIAASFFVYHYTKPVLYKSELYVKSNYFNSETCRLLANEFASNHNSIKIEAINTTNHHEWFNRLSLMSQAYPEEIRDWIKFQEMTAFSIVAAKKEELKSIHQGLIEYLEDSPYSQEVKSGLLASKRIDINKLEKQISSLKSENKEIKLISLQADLAKAKVEYKKIRNITVLLEKKAEAYRAINYKKIALESILISFIVFFFYTLFKRTRLR